MIEPLKLMRTAMIADASIPKDTSPGFSGVYFDPVKEEAGLRCVSFRLLFWRPNQYAPGMGTLYFDINVYDDDQARIFETMQHITTNYAIPIRRDQFLGSEFRMDELHFIDARTITKPKLTERGGAVHHMPIQAIAVIKPVGVY